jgi:putative ABC transport system permease protein
MSVIDVLGFSWGALRAHRVRTRMTFAALAVGVASVLLLTGLGEGARRWIRDRFSSLGANVLVALPGRAETRGRVPLAVSSTRDITLEDMRDVQRRLPGLVRLAPVVLGETTVNVGRRGRAATVVGTTRGFLEIRGIRVTLGTGLPDLEADQGARGCVIGRTIQRELFGTENPLGRKVTLGDSPYRVLGVIAQTGESMMMNLDEVVLVPVASALKMLNRRGLFRLIVQVSASADLDRAVERLTSLLKERHDGEEDFTVLTPGALAASLDRIVGLVTMGLAGIAAISLAVAGIGVMNVMVVSVTERTGEIGLMKALGAGKAQILGLFLAEAALLSTVGGAFGVIAGLGLTRVARWLYPAVPFSVPGWSLSAAAALALAVGLGFGLLPASRAARLEPLDALRRKRG